MSVNVDLSTRYNKTLAILSSWLPSGGREDFGDAGTLQCFLLTRLSLNNKNAAAKCASELMLMICFDNEHLLAGRAQGFSGPSSRRSLDLH